MSEEEHRETELEQELDNLYRKVAVLDNPDDYRSPKELETETLAGTSIQEPHEAQSAQEKKRDKFRISRRASGLVFALLFLGMIVFFSWPGIYRYITIDRGGDIHQQRIDRLTGEATYDTGKERLRPPVVTEMIRPKSEETKNPAVAALPAEDKEKKNKEPPVDAPLEGQRGKYAIQIRAYPENQMQDAITFLEDVRKREHDVSMETVHIAGRGAWYRILLGNFSTMEEAADYRKKHRLARKHPDSFIQRKSGNSP